MCVLLSQRFCFLSLSFLHRALEVSMLYGGPTHLKVIAEWEMETKANVFGVVPEIIPDPHDSVMELRQLYQQPLQCSLSDCLHIYTKEETVSENKNYNINECDGVYG